MGRVETIATLAVSIMSDETLPRLIPDRAPRLLAFDSGIGGLSVVREVVKVRPDADITYVADDAAFPYGDWDGEALKAHIVELMGRLIARYQPDLVFIPCNTASTLVLPDLRARHAVPFVGTVPAIKPAAEHTHSGIVAVLATPGTVKRDYTRALVRRFAADIEVVLVGSVHLARFAEIVVAGGSVSDTAIAQEIAPCFVAHDGRRTDEVVLACTHYPFLIDRFRKVAPWEVEWVDPAPAIARRVGHLVGERHGHAPRGRLEMVLTSGAAPSRGVLDMIRTITHS